MSRELYSPSGAVNEENGQVTSSPSSSKQKAMQIMKMRYVGMRTQPIYELQTRQLENLLLKPEYKDKPVVVISVAGAFRKGKSFLLNMMLRYLKAKQSGVGENWLGEPDESLEGFNWRGGKERETTGILLWSEPFLCHNPLLNREEVVVLMDTQGMFDKHSSVKECTAMFAMATLLSSSLIYNLQNNLQENDLHYLQLATEYGRLAAEKLGIDGNSKPLQELVFLIRDWQFPDDNAFGWDGGSQLVENWLQTSANQHSDLESVRLYLKNCFESIKCFLMPYPGHTVASSNAFRGEVREMEPVFVEHLRKFIEPLFGDGNLHAWRMMNGQVGTCADWVECFKKCAKQFQDSAKFPEPLSIFHAMTLAGTISSLESAKKAYLEIMEKEHGWLRDEKYAKQKAIEEAHEAAVLKARVHFDTFAKLDGDGSSAQYRTQLHSFFEDNVAKLKASNAEKIAKSLEAEFQLVKDEYKRQRDVVEQKFPTGYETEEQLLAQHKVMSEKASARLERSLLDCEASTLLSDVYKRQLSEFLKEQFAAFKSKNDARKLQANLDKLTREAAEANARRQALERRLESIIAASVPAAPVTYTPPSPPPVTNYYTTVAYVPSEPAVQTPTSSNHSGQVWVSGYTRGSGTEVAGYFRSAPSPPQMTFVQGYTRSNGTHVSGYYRRK